MSKRITVKDLNLKVDENFSRLDSKIDAIKKEESKVGDFIVMKAKVEGFERVCNDLVDRVEALENKQPWWKFEWIKKRMNK